MDNVGAAENELRVLLQKVARRIRAERGGHVTDSQLGALWRLSAADGASPGELAAHEKVSPPSMNRTINSLEESGYVRREPSPDDARRVRVRLTDEGRDLLAETARLRAEWFSAQLARLDDDERARLLAMTEVLRKLADS